MDFRPPFSHRFTTNRGSADPRDGHLISSSLTGGAGSLQTWSQIGQDFRILPQTAIIDVFCVTRFLNWFVSAGGIGYFSSEALANVVLFVDGQFPPAAAARKSLHQAHAPAFYFYSKPGLENPLLHGLRFFRTPGNASTGHAAFALETWSGGFGVGSALANAFGDLALIRVNQFDQARNLLQ